MQNYHCTPSLHKELGIISISDHLNGFDKNLYSSILDQIIALAHTNNYNKIYTGYVLPETIKLQYPNILFYYNQRLVGGYGWETMSSYKVHPVLNFKNFVCSFNGSSHVSRKLLVAILKKFEYFNPKYCSKNFTHSVEVLDGHIVDYTDIRDNFYRKFFISNNSEVFFQTKHSFGHVRFNHAKNIYNLESKLTESFLHIVSETMATSYVPFVTEKFLYSIVTRGLFLAYAQPGWHAHLEKYYGFKKYTKLFDYRFDSIKNPIERLVELITMISKFSKLSPDDWHDLYSIEQDTIEYNYEHYFSGRYLEHLRQHTC